ncbi:MAG TPA: response regulator transcription factor [Thermoanaerobaculia bacterium]|nr:response regulator transcription factor [Thermoanaerobaculia bacterium]
MIRVMIVEDQTIVRQGLRSLLALLGDIEIVGEAADGEEALALVPRVRPDVMLLDLRMPRLDGLGVLERLSFGGTLPPTLILTTFDDDEMLFEAVRAGARGYLLKDVSLDRLANAIRNVAAGRTAIEPVVTERIVRAFDHGDAPARPAPLTEATDVEALTDRENAVLKLVAGGYSNHEISTLLNITDGTVKNHISNVLAKLGVRDRTRAVLKAIDLGLI